MVAARTDDDLGLAEHVHLRLDTAAVHRALAEHLRLVSRERRTSNLHTCLKVGLAHEINHGVDEQLLVLHMPHAGCASG